MITALLTDVRLVLAVLCVRISDAILWDTVMNGILDPF
jgi:hypothetical protein